MPGVRRYSEGTVTEAQLISASFIFAAVLTVYALARVSERLGRLEKQNERKLDMLIAAKSKRD